MTPTSQSSIVLPCLTSMGKKTWARCSPAGFLEEPRRTLALLLPIADRGTKSWLTAERQRRKIDPRCGSCPYLKASQRHTREFSFWKERLLIVKDVFDEHQPKGIRQIWRDNRDPVQWWTFGVAIIVFAVMVVVSCVEGALQVV